MYKIQEILDKIINSNPIQNYFFAIAICIAIVVLSRWLKSNGYQKLDTLTKKTSTTLDDLIVPTLVNISNYFYYLLAVYTGSLFLSIPTGLEKLISGLLFFFIIYETIIISKNIFHFWITKKIKKKNTKSSKTVYRAIEKFFGFTIWTVAILFLLSHYGVNITALVTGLGVGGIAIAFAFKSILQDIFAYFTIVLDQPIREGDYIKTGEFSGTVDGIGIKSTRLKSIDGKKIIIPNDNITSKELENYGEATTRRILLTIGVAYDTPIPKLKKIKEKLKTIVTSFEDTDFLRCHLKTLADSSLEFELAYNITNRKYDVYMDINESVNIQILQYFKRAKIEIPYPTTTIYSRK